MLTINSENELEYFKRQRTLVTLFLDSGYTTKNIQLIMNAKSGFDAHVGPAWHMLIPYRHGYAIDMQLSKNDYGIELSRRIIRHQGIATGELPVILFENYNGDSDYFYISLGGMSQDEMMTIIGEVGDIVVENYDNGRAAPNDFREDITDAVKRHTRLRRVIKLVKRFGPSGIAAASLF